MRHTNVLGNGAWEIIERRRREGRAGDAGGVRAPGREWIVWAAAIGIADYGVYQLYRAATETLPRSGLLEHRHAADGASRRS
jgi:hypothetical protein